MRRLVVTGANGFVGQALCKSLLQQGFSVTGLVRHPVSLPGGAVSWTHVAHDFIGIEDEWARRKPACDSVIHLAARVHVMHDHAANAGALYRSANVDGTLRVARAAAEHGARRFVYVSSIKALGDVDRGRPWREDDSPSVLDAYGASKREAEDALFVLGRETGMEVVVVRPPLVYGPGVRANFLRLLEAVDKRMPLPLGAVIARRSLIGLDNLVDALCLCASHRGASGRVFHVTDGVDLSTRELVLELARLMQRPARLIAVPPLYLRWAGRLSGRSAQVERLISPLQVDSSRIRTELHWRPPVSIEQGLLSTVAWFRGRAGQIGTK